MSQYPMIPVPKAMDIVLRHTAEVLLESFHPTDSSEPQTQNTSSHLMRMDRMKTDDTSILGRISAQDIKLPVPGYPPFPASIMDGYAIHVNNDELSFKASDDPSVHKWTHEIQGSVFAGPYTIERNNTQESEASLNDNGVGKLPSAVYVTTGAVIPPEFNAVVPIEDCVVSTSDADPNDTNHNGGVFLSIQNNKVVKKGEWIRKVGSDIASNTAVLRAGQEIGPAQIGVLSQCGVSEVMVRRKPLVGILSSGNELMSISDVTTPNSAGNHSHSQGEIFDANRPALLALVNEIGGVGVDLGIASDDHDVLEQKLRRGLEECDILITSGGISMGDKDLLEDVLTQRFNAQVHFGRLHMKPGKPTTFFTYKNNENGGATKLLFALPGNPVSALVCSHLLLRPALTLLCRGTEQTSGNITDIVQNAIVHTEIDAVLAMDVKLDQVRPEYHRVSLRWEGGTQADGGGGGRFIATSTGMQRSSRLLSMNGADGLLCLPKGIPGEKMVCRAGETRPVLIIGGPFGGMMQGPKWKDCRHAATITTTSKPTIAVGVIGVNVNMKESDVIGKVERSFGNARVAYHTHISTGVTGGGEEVIQIIRNDDEKNLRNIQLVVVAVGGGFQRELDVSSSLRNFLEKRADAMALQARRGAAGDDGLAALFEVVVGWTDNKLVLCLPAIGLQGGLTSVSSLLGHAIALASGSHHGGKHTAVPK